MGATNEGMNVIIPYVMHHISFDYHMTPYKKMS